MFVQSPADYLAWCQTTADLYQQTIDIINAFLNNFGFFIPSGRDICLAFFNAFNTLANILP